MHFQMHGTTLRLTNGLGVSTIIVTTAHATTTTEGSCDAMIAMPTVTTAGHQTRGFSELSARASGMRRSPRVSGL
jgi:hypothetical protein